MTLQFLCKFGDKHADWEAFEQPVLVGILRQSLIRNNEHFSFRYDDAWLLSDYARSIDPELALYQGDQHAEGGHNFRIFLDSCPDRWGRTLMITCAITAFS